MKIHQLPLGATFEYEGEEYVKTGPMFATGKGGQRMIPRHAVLKVPTPAAERAGKERAPAVTAAFDAFCCRCAPLIPAEHQAAFAEARQTFLEAIG